MVTKYSDCHKADTPKQNSIMFGEYLKSVSIKTKK